MAIVTIQSQIQQLQRQLKLSQSPKQTKMLRSVVARLEAKLKEEAAIPKLEQQFLLLQQMSLASVQANHLRKTLLHSTLLLSQSDYLNLQSNLQQYSESTANMNSEYCCNRLESWLVCLKY